MKNNVRKSFLIILNILLIAPFIILYRRGAFIAISMVPVWFVMSVINTIFSKSVKEIVVYNGLLALTASIGILICGLLYFEFVCWDTEGELLLLYEIGFEILYIAMLTDVECFIKKLVLKRKK